MGPMVRRLSDGNARSVPADRLFTLAALEVTAPDESLLASAGQITASSRTRQKVPPSRLQSPAMAGAGQVGETVDSAERWDQLMKWLPTMLNDLLASPVFDWNQRPLA